MFGSLEYIEKHTKNAFTAQKNSSKLLWCQKHFFLRYEEKNNVEICPSYDNILEGFCSLKLCPNKPQKYCNSM